MSARALQRVVVRFLFDPALVDAVYAGREALADVDLTPAERAWLVAPDRRRWAVDPLRRTRGLQGLLEVYPVAGAEAAAAFGLAELDHFFSAPDFHRCVQDRGHLDAAFGGWLAGLGVAEVRAAALIERAIAGARRDRPPPAPGMWTTAAGVAGVALPEGALARWSALRARLMACPGGPVAGLLAGFDPRGAPPLSPTTLEGVVVERVGDEVAAGTASQALGALLARLDPPLDWPRTAAALRALGADPGEEAEVAAGLAEDGLLTSG